MRYRVLPYRQGSKGAKALATALGGKVLKLEDSKFSPRPNDVVINWGNTSAQPFLSNGGYLYLNPVFDIRMATNKLSFFQTMKESHPDDIPEFWTSPQEIPDGAFPVVCRTVLAGHSGDGIVIANNRDGLVPCSLYVKYVKKQEEYRIHVGMKDEPVVIAKQRKARRLEVQNPNWQIRNHQNGFIYAREGFTVPDSVVAAAKTALEATGLDFGAVDVLWNSKEGKAYVLEVNTAPGLEGQTVNDYADFFRGLGVH